MCNCTAGMDAARGLALGPIGALISGVVGSKIVWEGSKTVAKTAIKVVEDSS